MKQPFVEGRINGAYKRYNGEGKLMTEEHYKNGKKRRYLENITTIKESSYPSKITRMESLGANGNSGMMMPSGCSQNQITKAKKNYTLRIYYDNGKLSEEHTYKEGKEDGSQKYYQREGYLSKELLKEMVSSFYIKPIIPMVSYILKCPIRW